MSAFAEFMQRVSDALRPVFESLQPIPAPAERAISMSDVRQQASYLLYDLYPDEYLWIADIIEDDGELFGIVSYEGRLWRTTITIDGTNVSITPLIEVEVSYSPVGFASRGIRVFRDSEGKRYWSRVVSAAALLRGALLEIDSTELMDSFLAEIERTGKMPVAGYWHTGVRVGEAIALWRDDKVLCEVGRFDDTEIAQRLADHIESDPDFWGTSIEYYDDIEAAQIERIAGVEVIVHRKGVLTSCDFLPEKTAASLLTGGISVVQRGKTMTNEQKEMLKKIGLGDTDISAIEETARERNERAAEMITRAAQGDLEGAGESEAAEGEEEDGGGTAVLIPDQIELTEEAIDEIAEAVAERMGVAEVVAAMQAAVERANKMQEAIDALTAELATVRKLAEATDDKRRREIAATLPKSSTVVLTSRKSRTPDPEDDDEDDDDTDDSESLVRAHERQAAPMSPAAQFFAAARGK